MCFHLNIYSQFSTMSKDSLDTTSVEQDSFIRLTVSFSNFNSIITINEASNKQASDVSRLIQNQIAGLTINSNSYSPAASTSMILRGYRSFYGDNQPLILLDGLPINNAEWNNGTSGTDQSNRLMDIDPNSIESVELIKGSSARAKYGIVGGNGVIKILTKKGNQSNPLITYRARISQDQVSSLPELHSTYAQGRTDGFSFYLGPENLNRYSWGPKIEDLVYDGDSNYPFDKNGRLVQASNGASANAYDQYQFFENALNSNHSLQLNGGNKNLRYQAIVSADNREGIIPSTSFNRYNLSGSIVANLSEKWSLQLSTHLSNSRALRNQKGANLRAVMLGLLRTPASFDNSNGLLDPLNNPNSYIYDGDMHRSYNNGIYDNPYWSLNKSIHEDKVNRQLISVCNKYSLSEKLSVSLLLGYDQFKDIRVGGSDINTSSWSSFTGNAYERELKYSSQHIELSTQYDILQNNHWSVSGSLMFDYNANKSEFDINEGVELLSTDDVSISNVKNLESYNFTDENIRSGTAISLDADFKNFLTLSGSIRQDYSNKLGDDTNGFLSTGLRAELYLTNLMSRSRDYAVVNPFELKILGSIGKFGNPYGGQLGYGIYNIVDINGDGFISTGQNNSIGINNTFRSENLTAEQTVSYDLGFDMLYQPMSLQFSATYYNEKSSDLIIIDRVAPSTGYLFFENNLGSITNQGFDLSLALSPIVSKKLKWELSVRFNKNNNTVNNIGPFNSKLSLGGFSSSESIAIEGHSLGSIQGSAFLRNENNRMIIGEDGFPLVDQDRQIVADPNPDWQMYIDNQFNIGKSLSIQALIDIRQGGQMYCGTCSTLDYLGQTQVSADERGKSIIFEGVTETGVENTTSVELAPDDGNFNDFYRVRYGFGGITEMGIYNSSWLRLRSVSILYDLKNVIKLSFIESISIGIFAKNLLLLTDYPGIDPDTNLTGNAGGIGFDYYNNPATKSYGLNLNASF